MDMPGSLKAILAIIFLLILLCLVGSGYTSSQTTATNDEIDNLDDQVQQLDVEVQQLNADTQNLVGNANGSTFSGDLYVLPTGSISGINIGNTLTKQSYDSISNTQLFNCNVTIATGNTLKIGDVDVGFSINNLTTLINEGLYSVDSLTLKDLTVNNNATLNNTTSQILTVLQSLSFPNLTTQNTAYTGAPAGTYVCPTITIDENGKITAIQSGIVLSDAIPLAASVGTGYYGRQLTFGNIIIQFIDTATYGYPTKGGTGSTTINFPVKFPKLPYCVCCWAFNSTGGNTPLTATSYNETQFSAAISNNGAYVGFIAIGSI